MEDTKDGIGANNVHLAGALGGNDWNLQAAPSKAFGGVVVLSGPAPLTIDMGAAVDHIKGK